MSDILNSLGHGAVPRKEMWGQGAVESSLGLKQHLRYLRTECKVWPLFEFCIKQSNFKTHFGGDSEGNLNVELY